MKKVSVNIRCEKEDRVVEGFRVGAFVIHLSVDNRLKKWGVTHASTGFSAASSPTKASAICAAKRFMCLYVSWEFYDELTVKSWSDDILSNIHTIRCVAYAGGI